MADVISSARIVFTGSEDNNDAAREALLEILEDCTEEEDGSLTLEEPWGYAEADDYRELVAEVRESVNDLNMIITGETDYNGNEFQSFRIECSNGRIRTFTSNWYNKIVLEDYDEDEIDKVLDQLGIILTKEQQAEMQKRGYFLLEPDEAGSGAKRHLSFDPVMEIDQRLSDAVKADDSGYGPTEETAEIRVYSYDSPEIGASFTAEMALNNNGTPVYLLEYCYVEMPAVEFLATTKSVWNFYTNKDKNPGDCKELKEILDKGEIEHLEVLFEEVIEYEGLYKKQLMLLHDAVLKEAEKLNIEVGFEWEFN